MFYVKISNLVSLPTYYHFFKATFLIITNIIRKKETMLLLTRPKCFFLMGITQTLFRMKSGGYIMVKSLFLKKIMILFNLNRKINNALSIFS